MNPPFDDLLPTKSNLGLLLQVHSAMVKAGIKIFARIKPTKKPTGVMIGSCVCV